MGKHYKINKKNCFLFMFFILLFHSCAICDCWYEYRCIVENKSSSDIKIYYISSWTNPKINKTIILPNNTVDTIISYGELSGCSGWIRCDNDGPQSDYVKYLIDKIDITMNDTMKTKLNYLNYKNWNYNANGDTGFFKISLSDNDFIKR